MLSLIQTFTVGYGISPYHAKGLQTILPVGNLHPAPKTLYKVYHSIRLVSIVYYTLLYRKDLHYYTLSFIAILALLTITLSFSYVNILTAYPTSTHLISDISSS